MARLLGALLLLAPALALVVAATSSVGGATNHTAAFNVYAALLQTPAGFHGSVKKQGMLPPNKWSEDLYNKTHGKQFFRWLHASISDRTGEVTKVPPLTHVCGLWINHAYKVIFVRNRKAASTTLVNALGKPCRETTAPGAADAVLPCMEKVTSLKAFTDKGINPETVWRDYLVFGVARNPWARAASGYDYSTRKEQDPSLDPNFKNDKNHTFLEYCSDPMVLGKHCYELGADKCPGFLGKMLHNEPAARCFQDEQGRSVVDYVIRYESLQEDFTELMAVVNSRRTPGLPELPAELKFKTKGPLVRRMGVDRINREKTQEALESSARHVEKYVKCGEPCVRGVTAFYKEDISFFKFPVPRPQSAEALLLRSASRRRQHQ